MGQVLQNPIVPFKKFELYPKAMENDKKKKL